MKCSLGEMSSVNKACCDDNSPTALQLRKRHLNHSIPAFITAIKKQKKKMVFWLMQMRAALSPLFFSPLQMNRKEKRNNGSVCHQPPLIALPWQQF